MPSMISPAPSSADPSDPVDVRALALSLPLDDPDRHTLDPDDSRFAALAPKAVAA